MEMSLYVTVTMRKSSSSKQFMDESRGVGRGWTGDPEPLENHMPQIVP